MAVPVDLNLSFDETFEERLPGAMSGCGHRAWQSDLFIRVDEVLAAWEFIDPILALAKTRTPLSQAWFNEANGWVARADGRSWIDPHEDGRDDH